MVTPETSHPDLLTGALRRPAFEDRLRSAVREAAVHEKVLSLAFIDIDHFKEVNDKLGHSAGDEVLVSIADMLSELAGSEGVLSRYGGDEFALLLPGLDREQAFLTMEQMRTAVDQRKSYGAGAEAFSFHLTISVGIASYPIDGRNENELLRMADTAVYRAKVNHRNNIRLAYDERMVPKTTHYTLTQLERLSKLAQGYGSTEAELLREALDDLLIKHGVSEIVR